MAISKLMCDVEGRIEIVAGFIHGGVEVPVEDEEIDPEIVRDGELLLHRTLAVVRTCDLLEHDWNINPRAGVRQHPSKVTLVAADPSYSEAWWAWRRQSAARAHMPSEPLTPVQLSERLRAAGSDLADVTREEYRWMVQH